MKAHERNTLTFVSSLCKLKVGKEEKHINEDES